LVWFCKLNGNVAIEAFNTIRLLEAFKNNNNHAIKPVQLSGPSTGQVGSACWKALFLTSSNP
jgi:hypothetical protein